MGNNLSAPRAEAIYLPAQMGNEKTSTAQMGSEADNSWFSDPARAMLGSDPGLGLHVLTGIPERTAYRYASGERAPPGYLIRQLLRDPSGRQWLAAIMDGSDAIWWSDMQRAERITAAIDSVD